VSRVELEPDAVLKACAPGVFLESDLAFEILMGKVRATVQN
jgi:hypothetical protein